MGLNLHFHTATVAGAAVLIVDLSFLMQSRLRWRRVIWAYTKTNPLRRQLQQEQLRQYQPNRGRPPYSKAHFNPMARGDLWAVEYLRFTTIQILEMTMAFNLQDLQLRNRYRAPPETCLCLVLYRLAFPN
jgi:hypothetical protein